MNRIVREHYPVEKLPEDLRDGLAAGQQVTVTVEAETGGLPKASVEQHSLVPPTHIMSLEEIFAARRPPFRSAREISNTIRRDRDGWE